MSGINITRTREFNTSTRQQQHDATAQSLYTHDGTYSSASSSSSSFAVVALGGNLGHRARHLHAAMYALAHTSGIEVITTSYLYETTPVGSPEEHRTQANFLNAAILIRTQLDPMRLLDALQQIENECGRTRSGIRNGPRTVDIDIIFYGASTFHMADARLQLPHPRWHQRGFVLAPVRDLMRAIDGSVWSYELSSTALAVESAWSAWLVGQSTSSHAELIYRVLPFPTIDVEPDSDTPALSDVWRFGRPIGYATPTSRYIDADTVYPKRIAAPTYIMGILNLTPDSFSDGSLHTSSISSSVAAAKSLWDAGADIIDIGGESTRPGSQPVTPAEEVNRIIPVIEAIHAQYPHMKLSVDTYRPHVARLAIRAGCAMINDVYGGTYTDPAAGAGGETMVDVAAELNVPYVCMHMRGTTQTMTHAEYQKYDDVIKDVRREQEQQINRAILRPLPSLSASSFPSSPSPLVYRWNVIGDPGLGFAKSGSHAMLMLRSMRDLRPFGDMPLLVGASRKGFLAKAIEAGRQQLGRREPNTDLKTNPSEHAPVTPSKSTLTDRAWATAATVVASIEGGADIIRVHDVREMRSVRDIADQIYRA